MNQYVQEWPQFFTATIQNWKPLLKQDTYKNIIINTLRVLVSEGKLTVNGFVIMSNHVHIIWQSKGSYDMQKNTNQLYETYI
jgi:putative transposase